MEKKIKSRKGKDAPNYLDGRMTKKYYCANPSCNNEISYYNWLYSMNKMCLSCYKKKKISWNKGKKLPQISGKNNPMYGKRGKLSPNYGIKRTKKFKNKISLTKKRLYKEGKLIPHNKGIFKKRMNSTCKNCSKNFNYYNLSDKTKKRSFCSLNCWYDYAKKNSILKELQKQNRVKRIDVICFNCGKKLAVREKRWNKNKTKRFYCSMKCYSKFVGKFKPSKETRKKMSIGAFNFYLNHPKEALERIRKARSSTVPNKLEQLLSRLLLDNKLEYKFVGNSKFWIENFNPDFINCNGQKKIIEVFGDYWHNLPKALIKDKQRLYMYGKYGYKTLILWEHEFKDIEKMMDKVKVFDNE